MWLNNLKIAIIEKNIEKINTLLEDIPQLDNQEDIDSALHLLKEATNFVSSLRNDTKDSMLQMQKTIKFLKVTQEKRPSRLDIKS